MFAVKHRLTKVFSLILVLCFLPVSAEDKTDFYARVLKSFEIISADTLNFKDGNSILEGNTKIRLDDYVVSADRVEVITPKDKKLPSLVKFLGEVDLQSKDIRVLAATMEVDVEANLFKCFKAEKEAAKVRTFFRSKDQRTAADINISSDYQEFDFANDIARAQNGVLLESEERDIVSENAELFLRRSSDSEQHRLEAVDFSQHVVLLEKDKRVEAEDLFYLPEKNIIRIADNAKILYFNDEKGPIYLFADFVMLETDDQIFSAYSSSTDKSVRMYMDGAYAEARQLRLNQAKDGKPDHAVLTGHALAQLKDKAVLGEEVLFDLDSGYLKTLVGRPITRIFSADAGSDLSLSL